MSKFELKLPKMGESVAEATLTAWLKDIGDTIEFDEAVVEIATDKVDSEVPSEKKGVLIEKCFQINDVIEVGQTIAIIETDEIEISAETNTENNIQQANAQPTENKNIAENITINSTLMSINCHNIIKLVEYSHNNKFDFFLNTYAKHGRITSPDWGLNNLDENIISDVTKDCNKFLEKCNNLGYNMQVKKILLLLKNIEYTPKGNWEHMKDA